MGRRFAVGQVDDADAIALLHEPRQGAAAAIDVEIEQRHGAVGALGTLEGDPHALEQRGGDGQAREQVVGGPIREIFGMAGRVALWLDIDSPLLFFLGQVDDDLGHSGTVDDQSHRRTRLAVAGLVDRLVTVEDHAGGPVYSGYRNLRVLFEIDVYRSVQLQRCRLWHFLPIRRHHGGTGALRASCSDQLSRQFLDFGGNGRLRVVGIVRMAVHTHPLGSIVHSATASDALRPLSQFL